MKMPKITIDNHKKIYEYLTDYRLNRTQLRLWHTFYGIFFNPRVFYAKGARKDLDQIRDNDYHHIYVANHRGDWDGQMYWAIIRKISPTDAGKVRLLTHSMGFESNFAKLCRNLGTIPVFLKTYYMNSDRHKDYPERLAYVPASAESMLNCLATVMTKHHQRVFVFPEGEFNSGALDTILPIRKGTAVVAQRVAKMDDSPVAITTVGIAYNNGKRKKRHDMPFRASLYVERPIFVTPSMTVEEVTQLIHDHLLTSVKKAVGSY